MLREYGGETIREQAMWMLNGDGELDKKSLTQEEVDDYMNEFWGEVDVKFNKSIDEEVRKLLG